MLRSSFAGVDLQLVVRPPHVIHDLLDLQDRGVDDEEALEHEHDQHEPEQQELERGQPFDMIGRIGRGSLCRFSHGAGFGCFLIDDAADVRGRICT